MKLIINIIFYLLFVVGLTIYFDFELLGIVVLTLICGAILIFFWKFVAQIKIRLKSNHTIIIILIIALSVFIYMFRYEHKTHILEELPYETRINRITGSVCYYAGPPDEAYRELTGLKKCK